MLPKAISRILTALAACALFSAAALPAAAQNPSYYIDNTGKKVPVTPATPLPTTATITGGGDASAANQVIQSTKLDTLHTDIGSLAAAVATAANQVSANTKLDTLHTDLTSTLTRQLAATENHIGNVTGQMTFVATTPTTTAATRASGDVVGGLLTFSSAGRVSGGTGLVQSAMVDWKSTQSTANAAMDIFLFSDTSLSSTCTNASAFVLSASDWAKVRGVIHLTDTTVGNTTTHVQATGLALPYSTAATTLYGCAVTRGAPVVGSTTDITVTLGLVEN